MNHVLLALYLGVKFATDNLKIMCLIVFTLTPGSDYYFRPRESFVFQL